MVIIGILVHFLGRLSYNGLFIINAVITLAAVVCGLGFGTYASVSELQETISGFGIFAPCYQC